MSTKFIGKTFPPGMEYSIEEISCCNSIKQQIDLTFPDNSHPSDKCFKQLAQRILTMI